MVKKSGKYFEKKTAEVLKNLRPNEKVHPNVKLLGKLSKKKRQIDVLVEPADFDIIIFECKDHKRPIDLDKFGVFTGILEDINVKKAAMVSNSPYTDGVKNLAAAKNIDLLHLIDSGDPNIQTHLTAPVLLTDSKLKNFQMSFETTAAFTEPMSTDPVIRGPHFTGQGRDYIKYLWNDTEFLSEETGTFEFTLKDVGVIGVNGNPIHMDKITFIYDVVKEHYIGDLKIIDTQGIYNVKEGSFQTKSLKTEPLNAYDVEKVWKMIPEEEAQKIKISMGFVVKSILST